MKNYIYLYLLVAATATLAFFFEKTFAENIAFVICQLIFIWNSYAFERNLDMLKLPMLSADVSKRGKRSYREFLYWACNIFSILVDGVLIASK